MLQVHTEHIVLNAIGNMTAKTRYLILNIFDLLHDRHGCEGTACGLLTMLVAATLSKLSLSRLGSDNTHVTLDGNNVVVALTKTRRKRPNSGSSPQPPCCSNGRHGASPFEARKAAASSLL